MPRSLPTEMETAVDDNIDSDVMISVAIGLFLDIDGDPTYMWTGEGTIQFDGNDWLGVGGMGEMTGINEGGGDADYQIKAVLNHIDLDDLPDFVEEFATNNQVGRDYELYFIIFDTDGSIYFYLLSAGFMDATTIKEGDETGSIEQILSNETTKMGWKFFVRLSHQTQQEIWPGDDFLEYLNDTQLQELTWGANGSNVADNGREVSYGGTGSGQPGKACFGLNMEILLPGNRTKFLADVTEGDKVISWTDTNFDKHNSPMDWNRSHMNMKLTVGTVTRAELVTVPRYVLIDGFIEVSTDHPFLIYRAGFWQLIRAEGLNANDLVCDDTGKFALKSVEVIEKPLKVMSISVDKNKTYFAGRSGRYMGGHNK